MIFLAQIACEEFPKDLWGRVGPREGWLLFFFSSHLGKKGAVGKIVYTKELGPERSEYLEEEVFRRSPCLDLNAARMLEPSATPFPRWPVRLIDPTDPEAAIGADKPEKRLREIGEKVRAAAAWPGGAAGHPITWELFDTFVSGARERVKKAEITAAKLIEECRDRMAEIAELPPSGRHYWHDHEHAQRSYAIEKFKAYTGLLKGNSEALQSGIPTPASRQGLGPDMETWNNCLAALSRVPELSFKVVEVEKGFGPLKRISFNYSTIDIDIKSSTQEIHTRLLHLEHRAKKIISGKSGYRLSDIGELISSQEYYSQQPLPKTVTKEIRDYVAARDRLIAENNVEIERARAVANALWAVASELRRLLAKLGLDKEMDEDFQRQISGILVRFQQVEAVFPKESELRSIPSLNEYEFYEKSFADPGDRHGWQGDFERKRALVAQSLYFEDANQLPDPVRAHFEPIWRLSASYAHDRIGGEPHWDHVNPAWFHEDREGTPEERAEFLERQPYYNLPDPFNEENAMVLQLFPDLLMGWSWGDVSHAVFIVPRRQIEDCTFSDVAVVVAG
jgi:hypothetical protein